MNTVKKPASLLNWGNKSLLYFLLAAGLVFTWAVVTVFVQKKTTYDDAAFQFFIPLVSSGLTDIVIFISFLGKHSFLVPANFLLLFWFLYKQEKGLALRVALVALSSLGLKQLLKFLFDRDRPAEPLLHPVPGLSFPSGHALLGLTFYGLIILVILQKMKKNKWRHAVVIFLVLLILAIALSRVYLRVHYFTDIMAGLALGFIWLLLSLWLIEKAENRYIVTKNN